MPAHVYGIERRAGAAGANDPSAATMREATALLPLLGARWSDVFGPDRIVWVEGETEAACYPLLLQAKRSLEGTSFIPLHATGDIVGKKLEKAKLAFEIYSKASAHMSLAAQRCLIVLDRETLSEAERQSISSRISFEVVRFAPYSMFEDLLLDIDAITSRLVAVLHDVQPPVSAAEVREGVSRSLDSRSADQSSARVLEALFSEVSMGKAEYRKVQDGIELTKFLLVHKPGHFDDLLDWLIGTLQHGSVTPVPEAQ